jgi:hypothetical protein
MNLARVKKISARIMKDHHLILIYIYIFILYGLRPIIYGDIKSPCLLTDISSLIYIKCRN